MSKTTTDGWLPRSATRALHWLWLAVAAPWLVFAVRDLFLELREPGYAGDPPNHVGALVVVRALLPGWVACLAALAALTLYVSIAGNGAARRRVAIWSSVSVAYVALEPTSTAFGSRALFDAVEVAWLGLLAALPLVWLFAAPKATRPA